MIQRNGDEYELTCDHCEKSLDGFDRFNHAVQYKKEYGWKSVKTKTLGWVELCPQCATPETIEEYRGR
jgi:hypothetical protein